MARRKVSFKCGPERQGKKVCTIGGKRVVLHAKATAATKAKRRAAGKRLARKYGFTSASARRASRKAHGKRR